MRGLWKSGLCFVWKLQVLFTILENDYHQSLCYCVCVTCALLCISRCLWLSHSPWRSVQQRHQTTLPRLLVRHTKHPYLNNHSPWMCKLLSFYFPLCYTYSIILWFSNYLCKSARLSAFHFKLGQVTLQNISLKKYALGEKIVPKSNQTFRSYSKYGG